MAQHSIGSFIAALRKEKGMTQRQLAEKLNVSDKTVSRWEREESQPDLSLIPDIADLFGITADELLRGQRSEHIPIRESLVPRPYTNFRIQTVISWGIILLGLIAVLTCRFAIGYRYGVLGYFLGLLCFMAAGVCQIIFTLSALSGMAPSDPFADRIAGSTLNLIILLLTLTFGTIPVMNSSLDFWEVALVGGLITSTCGGILTMVSWFLVIPRLAAHHSLFQADAGSEALQNLRKETVFWAALIIGIWIFLTLFFSAVSSTADTLYLSGLVVLVLTVPVSLIIYRIRKRRLK